jgi:hypothetical protein
VTCSHLFGNTANAKNNLPIKISYLEDPSNQKSIAEITNAKFVDKKNQTVLNFGITNSTFWVKIAPTERLITKNDFLHLAQSRFVTNEMYLFSEKSAIEKGKPFLFFNDINYKKYQGISYKLPDTLQTSDVIYLKLKAEEAFLTQISITDNSSLLDGYAIKDIIFGLYSGIMMVMFFYNLFLYIVVRDKSYVVYIFYILSTWLSQIAIQGYKVKLLWELNSHIDSLSVVLFSSISLLFAALFTISFLNTKLFAPVIHKTLVVYCYLICLNLLGIPFFNKFSLFINLQLLIIIGVVIALSSSSYIYYKKHFKPAGYYLLAWSVLLLGVVLFILKDYGIIPYNNFTAYLMQIASAFEVILLSFALADKINFFKKENEIAQAQALNASLENERLIKEQNIILEQKVKVRTEELEQANDTLNTTLDNLKSAQTQLVDSEKMAALGQLTAGIAHEINNPINFVTSNVKPLKLDFDDLKEVIKKYEEIDPEQDLEAQLEEINAFKKEIDLPYLNKEISSLLDGISEGAKRTAEIIQSLRNFSRLDESDTKEVNLNEGLESTLVLVRNNMPHHLVLTKELSSLPMVECLPGKINQVFMNLISNAIQAINSKEKQNEQEYLTIKSWYEAQEVKISIKDSGGGMSEETKHRIFEPFFTTKPIGEGTGLGLSIVFSIIEKHKGNIEVNSTLGEGTEFIITLPVNSN